MLRHTGAGTGAEAIHAPPIRGRRTVMHSGSHGPTQPCTRAVASSGSGRRLNARIRPGLEGRLIVCSFPRPSNTHPETSSRSAPDPHSRARLRWSCACTIYSDRADATFPKQTLYNPGKYGVISTAAGIDARIRPVPLSLSLHLHWPRSRVLPRCSCLHHLCSCLV